MKNWRDSREYRYWRVKVIRRDKRCQICYQMKHRHAHHLNHASYFIDQRYDPDNGICLCKDCHSMFHNKFIGNNRKKCTKKDYYRFTLLKEYFKKKITP